MNTYQYSVDTLKKAAFVDELNNVLKVMELESPNLITKDITAVMEYLQKRLNQIEAAYKN